MAKKFSNLLQFNNPASWWGERWREGLFSGNGKTGANVFGGISTEKILINDACLMWQGRTNVVPDVATKLREVRKKIQAGDFLEGQNVIPKLLQSKNFHPQWEIPLPLCHLNIQFLHTGVATGFSRTLNMETGEVSSSYSLNGTKFFRSLFVSRDNNMVVYQISKQGSATISANISATLADNEISYDANVLIPDGVSVALDKQCLCFSARNNDDGTDFGIVLRVSTNGGMVRSEDGQLKVVEANSVFVLAETFCSSNREKEFSRLKAKLNSTKDNFDKMLRAHSALHSKLFNTVSVELDSDEKSVEELFAQANAGNISPLMLEKLYKFGRYLYICSATPNGDTAMLPTGLWNGSYKPSRAFVSNSGEIQLAYMHTLTGNLATNLENLFGYFEKNISDYQTNAMRLFGCRGIFVPTIFAPNTGRLGSADIFAVHFTGCGALVSNFFCRYMNFSQNAKFLKTRLLPFMKEVAAFYEDFFVEKDGQLICSPSAMPMRVGDSAVVVDRPVIAKNSALDFAIAKDFFSNLINFSLKANVNKNDIKRWEALASKFPEPQQNSDGIFREFINSTTVDYTGISVGTLYPSYFSNEVSMFSSIDEIELYERTADAKLQNSALQNSFYMAILATVYARLGNSFKAKQCISNITRASLMGNLVAVDKDWRGMGICGDSKYAPMHLYTNYLMTHAIQEMLLYSNGDIVSILPSIPADFKNLEYDGLVCECGVSVFCNLNSEKGTLVVQLSAKKDTKIQLFLPQGVKKLMKCSNKAITKLTTSTTAERSLRDLNIEGGKVLSLSFKYSS